LTYRWSKSNLEQHVNHISNGVVYEEGCIVCAELHSILAAMELTDQKYVYIKGQPEY